MRTFLRVSSYACLRLAMQSKDFVDRIDMIIDSIHSDKSQAFLGLKRLHAILKKNIEDIVVINIVIYYGC